MQILKSNPDGSGQTIEEVPPQSSVANEIEYGRAASVGGFITLLGGGFRPGPLEPPPIDPKPGEEPPPPAIPSVLAVFNNGAQIACYIV